MRRISAIALVLVFCSTAAFADALRSDKHLIRIDVQPGAGDSRQYEVEVFDAESRTSVAQMNVTTNGNTPADDETTIGGTRYGVRIVPYGQSYLIEFTADGAEMSDRMRGGFSVATAQSRPQPARALRAGREIAEPAVLRRAEPLYTEDAKAAGASGTVIVEVRIDKSGFVQDATVVKPMGYGLSESAVDAAKQFQFAPSMQDRKGVEVLHEITFEFKL